MDITDFHVGVGHLHEGLLHDTAGQLGVSLTGELQPCTGCSLGKGYRKAIPSTTSTRATRKLQRVFTDLSGKKAVAGIGGVHYTMIIRDDLTRYTWVYSLKHKSDAAEMFEQFLSDVRHLGEVETVRSDDGGEVTSKEFIQVCSSHRIKRELTTAESSAYNGVAERALAISRKPPLPRASKLLCCTRR